jgi:ABC-type amino acid transport substrate-binding protein
MSVRHAFSLRMLLVALLSGTVLLLAGCKEESGGRSAGGAAASKIKVGTEATFPPFEMRDAQGNFTGFDIDLVRAIGEKAGFEVEFVDMGFDALIPALQSGQIQMIASGLSITDERKQAVDFSNPYIQAGLAVVVRADEESIKTPADLQGTPVAVQTGSTGAKAAEKLKEEGRIGEIKYFQNVPLAMMELGQGGVAAVINDRPTSEAFQAQQPGKIKLLPETLESDSYGFAFRKGDAQLADRVNVALRQLEESGAFDTLKAKYFTGAPTTAPAAAAP